MADYSAERKVCWRVESMVDWTVAKWAEKKGVSSADSMAENWVRKRAGLRAHWRAAWMAQSLAD